jgi:hypothetical protein
MELNAFILLSVLTFVSKENRVVCSLSGTRFCLGTSLMRNTCSNLSSAACCEVWYKISGLKYLDSFGLGSRCFITDRGKSFVFIAVVPRPAFPTPSSSQRVCIIENQGAIWCICYSHPSVVDGKSSRRSSLLTTFLYSVMLWRKGNLSWRSIQSSFLLYAFIGSVNFTTCSENIIAGLQMFVKCSKSFM